jgi:hypothetical protein
MQAGLTFTGTPLDGPDVEADSRHWNRAEARRWREEDNSELSWHLAHVQRAITECEKMADLADGFNPLAVVAIGPASVGPINAAQTPRWIAEHFRQQQFKLLRLLWEAGVGCEVVAAELAKALGFLNPISALESLHRAVTRVNAGLCEKAKKLGNNWTISQRDRDGQRVYYLERLGRTVQETV